LHRNWLLKKAVDGKEEGNEKTLVTEEEALDGTLCKILFGRTCGPVVNDRPCKE
jgi:hypothetical protein